MKEKTKTKTKNNLNAKLKERFIEADKISALYNKNNGVSTYHILLALINMEPELKGALNLSVILYNEFYEDLINNIKSFKIKKNEKRISNELKAIVVSVNLEEDREDYEVFVEKILHSQSIKKMLNNYSSKPSEVIKLFKGETNEVKQENKKERSNLETFKNSELLNNIIGKKHKINNQDLPESNISLIDLNKLAINDTNHKMIGRNEEIQRIIQVMQRKTKNTPIIVGDSGVGKSKVIQHLAYKIEKGDVPEFLKGKKIVELDKSSMIENTHYRGALEKNVNILIKKIKDSNGELILYIDDLHSISKKSPDKSNILELLKPTLDKNQISCICTTSIEDLRKIESETAFERIFQKIVIEQPSIPETISILRCLKSNYEEHHNVTIDDNAIIQAVKLSERYITAKKFPDKAIDLIDEAASIVKMAIDSKPQILLKLENKILQKTIEKESLGNSLNYEVSEEVKFIEEQITYLSNQLDANIEVFNNDLKLFEEQKELRSELSLSPKTEEQKVLRLKLQENIQKGFKILKTKVSETEILEVISQKTSIPLDKMGQDDKSKVLNINDKLSEKVIGQKDAIKVVSSAIKRSYAGLSDPNKPIGSFLFLGSTGVGKTEVCKQLAIELFDNEKNFIRLDMSEYMGEASLNQMIGSPIGYEGSESGGMLTEAVIEKPYSIVLFDEIEKAHPKILNILLQILDDGRLTDARGRLVNFKNTIIVMTSNIGAEHIKSSFMFGDLTSRIENKVLKELEKVFKPELINRIDERVVFKRLEIQDIRKICEISLNNLKKRISNQNIDITFSDETVDYIASVSLDPKYGARPLARKIKRLVEENLADYILTGDLKKGDKINFHINKSGLRIQKIDQ